MERCSKGRNALTVTLHPGTYDVRCAAAPLRAPLRQLSVRKVRLRQRSAPH
jgi:hypothetical protein